MNAFRLYSIVALCLLSGAARADDVSRAAWRETSFMEDESGKRTPCTAGFCGDLGGQSRPSPLICTSAKALQSFGHQQVSQMAMLFRSHLHNCSEDTGGDITCDEGKAASTYSQPDATHVAFSFTTEGIGHRQKHQWLYERVGDSCNGTNATLP